MTARSLLVPLAALVAAAALVGVLLVPAAIGGRHTGRESADRLDGWANRDIDIGAFGVGVGSRLDGWANRDLDIGAYGFTAWITSILDGWANRDLDVGTL